MNSEQELLRAAQAGDEVAFERLITTYRGELQVVLLNTDRDERFVVEAGMRIAQLVVVPVAIPEPVEVAELPASDRGERGFGSSAH